MADKICKENDATLTSTHLKLAMTEKNVYALFKNSTWVRGKDHIDAITLCLTEHRTQSPKMSLKLKGVGDTCFLWTQAKLSFINSVIFLAYATVSKYTVHV